MKTTIRQRIMLDAFAIEHPDDWIDYREFSRMFPEMHRKHTTLMSLVRRGCIRYKWVYFDVFANVQDPLVVSHRVFQLTPLGYYT